MVQGSVAARKGDLNQGQVFDLGVACGVGGRIDEGHDLFGGCAIKPLRQVNRVDHVHQDAAAGRQRVAPVSLKLRRARHVDDAEVM